MNLILTKRGISIRRSVGMRAGEVIRVLRTLGRKSGPQLSRLDVDDVIGQVHPMDVRFAVPLSADC